MEYSKKEKRGGICFYNIDNIEFMKTKPDNFYDLAIVDPPYNVINDSKATGFKNDTFKNIRNAKNWDIKPPKKYWEELFRVSRNQIIWGFQYFIDELKPTKSIIIWDKMNGANFMNDAELAWYNGKGNNTIFKHAYIGRYHPEPIKIHPTQKPTMLYRWLLNKYAESGMKILDTHGGSMTIAKACDMEGFDLDICEIDKEYFNNGLKAFDEYKMQGVLF